MNITRNLLVALFMLLAVPSWATTYYISGSGTTANDGLSTANPKHVTDWASIMASMSVSDDVSFERGYVYVPSAGMEVTVSGTSSNRVNIGSYGTGALPIFRKLQTFAPSWTSVSGNVYKASMDAGMIALYASRVNILLEDGERLNGKAWTTDEATTAASMTAGTFANDITNKIIYVYTSDGANPSTHTWQYAPLTAYFATNVESNMFTGHADGAEYVTFDGLHLEYWNMVGIPNGDWGDYCIRAASNITVKNSTFRHGGMAAATVSGVNGVIDKNTVYDAGGSFTAAGDTGSFQVSCGNFYLTNNTVDLLRRGTALEITHDITSGLVSGNTLTRGYGSCIELGGGNYTIPFPPTRNVVVERNYCDNEEAPYTVTGGSGISLSIFTENATVRNNFFKGNSSRAIRIKYASDSHIYNNTYVSPSTGWDSTAVFQYEGATPGTQLYNNIFIDYGTLSEISSDASVDAPSSDYNYWYTPTGTYTNQLSGQDTNSTEGNPLLAADFTPTGSSLTVDAGMSISGMETLLDGDGSQRVVNILDIGAYEYPVGRPIDANPSESLTALYNKLTSPGHKIRYGHHYESGFENGEITEAFKITGKDLSYYEYRAIPWTIYAGSPYSSPDTDLAKAKYDAGAIISIMYPAQNFSSTCTGSGCGVLDMGEGQRNMTGNPCDAILSTGGDATALAAYRTTLDRLALWATTETRFNNRAFIFRPFHENDGNWFWWGTGATSACSDADYVQLWRETVEYLRDTKGVHNILYAYSPEVIGAYTDYTGSRYPGDAYVDIFGIDVYSNTDDLNATGCAYYDCDVLARYRHVANKAKERGKIFAITEGMRDQTTAFRSDYWTWWIDQILADSDLDEVAYITPWAPPFCEIEGRGDEDSFREMFLNRSDRICALNADGSCYDGESIPAGGNGKVQLRGFRGRIRIH